MVFICSNPSVPGAFQPATLSRYALSGVVMSAWCASAIARLRQSGRGAFSAVAFGPAGSSERQDSSWSRRICVAASAASARCFRVRDAQLL